MRLTIENLPYLCLLWIGLGFIIILIGVFTISYMRYDHSEYGQYVNLNDIDSLRHEESFSQILETKEKRSNEVSKDKIGETEIYSEIQRLYKDGKQEEEIAKTLNIGVGEVQLILSLYKMR